MHHDKSIHMSGNISSRIATFSYMRRILVVLTLGMTAENGLMPQGPTDPTFSGIRRETNKFRPVSKMGWPEGYSTLPTTAWYTMLCHMMLQIPNTLMVHLEKSLGKAAYPVQSSQSCRLPIQPRPPNHLYPPWPNFEVAKEVMKESNEWSVRGPKLRSKRFGRIVNVGNKTKVSELFPCNSWNYSP